MLWCAVARADAIKHPSGFTFNLPDIGKNWEQEGKGDLFIVSDESDTLPELTVYVFPPKQAGTLEEIQSRLQAELSRVTLDGEAIKTVKVVHAKQETVADARAVRGSMTLNSTNAVFAVVQRNGMSLILVGVPKEGIFERGSVNFREILNGLQKAATASKSVAAKPAPDFTKAVVDVMPEIAIIKDVTATSTFVDKRKKDAYSPTKVIWFDVKDDADVGGVPKTAWCEGKPDEGVGETLTINFARPEAIDSIEIASGVWLSDKLFKANNQITALDVGVDGKTVTVKPAETRQWTEVKIGKPVTTLTLKLAAVKKNKMNDSCISGVRINRGKFGLDIATANKLPAEQAAALPTSIAAIQSALVDPSYTALQKVVDFPLTFVFVKKTKFTSWKAVEAACKKQRDADSCPYGTFFDHPPDGAHLSIVPVKAGEVTVEFWPSGGSIASWRLKWRDGAWRLVATEMRAQQQD